MSAGRPITRAAGRKERRFSEFSGDPFPGVTELERPGGETLGPKAPPKSVVKPAWVERRGAESKAAGSGEMGAEPEPEGAESEQEDAGHGLFTDYGGDELLGDILEQVPAEAEEAATEPGGAGTEHPGGAGGQHDRAQESSPGEGPRRGLEKEGEQVGSGELRRGRLTVGSAEDVQLAPGSTDNGMSLYSEGGVRRGGEVGLWDGEDGARTREGEGSAPNDGQQWTLRRHGQSTAFVACQDLDMEKEAPELPRLSEKRRRFE